MRASRIAEFQEVSPSLESYWRSIILFGRNASTYKFALSRSLEDLARKGKADVSLDELAAPFSRHMCEHMLVALNRQRDGRERSSRHVRLITREPSMSESSSMRRYRLAFRMYSKRFTM